MFINLILHVHGFSSTIPVLTFTTSCLIDTVRVQSIRHLLGMREPNKKVLL